MSKSIGKAVNSNTTRLHLTAGSHASRDEGTCALEMVAWLSGAPHTDRPTGVCPIIAAFVRGINDSANESTRDELIPHLTVLIGTIDPAMQQSRNEFFAWQAIHAAGVVLRGEGKNRFGRFLGASTTLEEARGRAERIREIMRGREKGVERHFTPIDRALYHAHRAANCALWFARSSHLPFGGATSMTPETASADSSASVFAIAFELGIAEAWSMALQATGAAAGLENGAAHRWHQTECDRHGK
ncbi:hypothetical protein [Mesorhizobium shangrilense]|uniref:Uncharacterized protein n=1 Tax=Mesorhizobium shangrilense TaxID=460060 RepID=A0ABV2D733_9HYPH